MLKGMISKIRRKGGALLKRRLPSFRKPRRKFRRYRLKPEVKWTYSTFNSTPVNNLNTSVSSVGSYALFSYPTQGLTDLNRIGDTIRPVMILFKYTFYSITTVFAPFYFRVVVFTTNNNDNDLYFPFSTDRAVLLAPITLEKVNKVYYDKMHLIPVSYYNTLTSKAVGGATSKRTLKIRLRKPIIFSSGSTTPKKDSDNFRVAIFGWSNLESSGTTLGYFQGISRFYWTDA